MTIRWLAPLALLFALSMSPALAGDDPAAANLAMFLTEYGHQSGLPDAATAADMRAGISEGLHSDMAVARIAQTEFVRDHPDEKPPWIEGPLFNSSAYEPYTAFEIVRDPAADAAGPGAGGDRRLLQVKFTDDTVTPAVTWTDTFAMVHEDGSWRVDDVAYRAGFDFGNHGTLRANLRAENLAEPGAPDAASADAPEPAGE